MGANEAHARCALQGREATTFASEPVAINVKNVGSISRQVMTSRTEHVHLRYAATQLFDLIADVERYPEFLPWVLAARIRRREGQTIWVDMTLGTRFLRRRFSTVGLLERPHRITINSDDAMLERFEQRWTFKTAPDGGADVEYRVDFRFRSRLLQALIGGPFADRAQAIAQAFNSRARQLYGAPLLSNPISS